jgi:hypothetical protein
MPDVTDNSTSDAEAEDFRALWTVSTEDIRFFKSQQYSVANYAIALYAALFAIFGASGMTNTWRICLAFGAFAIGAFGIYQNHALQRALTKSRRFAHAGRTRLSRALSGAIASVRRGPDDAPEGFVRVTRFICGRCSRGGSGAHGHIRLDRFSVGL